MSLIKNFFTKSTEKTKFRIEDRSIDGELHVVSGLELEAVQTISVGMFKRAYQCVMNHNQIDMGLLFDIHNGSQYNQSNYDSYITDRIRNIDQTIKSQNYNSDLLK